MENSNSNTSTPMDFAPKTLTYGEKAVGLTFNPSNDGDVQRAKELYAQIIDVCNDKVKQLETAGADAESIRSFKIAITEAQTAQMWIVKALTWKY